MEKLISGFPILLAFANYAVEASIDPSNFNFEDMIKIADAKIREQCINVTGEEKSNEALEKIEMGVMTLVQCFRNYRHLQRKKSIESPGDSKLNTFCNTRSDALKCVEDFNDKLVPCLDSDKRKELEDFMRIMRSLLSFICHEGANKIELFIAENGQECIESKFDDIKQCIISTFSHYLPKEGIENIKNIPKLVIGNEQCHEFQRLETCIVEKLKTCSKNTSANIVESVFRIIKNETICRNVLI